MVLGSELPQSSQVGQTASSKCSRATLQSLMVLHSDDPGHVRSAHLTKGPLRDRDRKKRSVRIAIISRSVAGGRRKGQCSPRGRAEIDVDYSNLWFTGGGI